MRHPTRPKRKMVANPLPYGTIPEEKVAPLPLRKKMLLKNKKLAKKGTVV